MAGLRHDGRRGTDEVAIPVAAEEAEAAIGRVGTEILARFEYGIGSGLAAGSHADFQPRPFVYLLAREGEWDPEDSLDHLRVLIFKRVFGPAWVCRGLVAI